MLTSVLSGAKEYVLGLLLSLPGILLAMCLHEYAHGQVSVWLGDPTPKATGRLSLNPFHHLDPVGLLMLVLLRFGWAKPVMIDPRYYKNPKVGTALTALAGPVMNLVTAFLMGAVLVGISALYALLYASVSGFVQTMLQVIFTMVYYAQVVSVGLALFNLIPVPPLDGSKVLMRFLPRRACAWMIRNERWCYLALILLMFSIPGRVLGYAGVPASVTQWLSLNTYLTLLRDWVLGLYDAFWALVFGL